MVWEYIRVKTDDGWKLEHRVVMENHLGRELKRDEIVHHNNRDGRDNRIENLKLLDCKTHNNIHHIPERIHLNCPTCNKDIIIRKKFYIWKKNNGQKKFYCSKKCETHSRKSKYEDIIQEGLKNGWSVYKIAKFHNIDRRALYYYVRKKFPNKLIQRKRVYDGNKKQCSKCKELKPFSEFGKHSSNCDGLRTYCKECRHKYNC